MNEAFEYRLKGSPISPGIAMGTIRVEARGGSSPRTYSITENLIEHEWARLDLALEHTEMELYALKARVEAMSGANEAAIFDVHLLLVRDRTLMQRVQTELRKRLHNVESVYYAVVQNYMEIMRHVDDPYLSSRVADMDDVMRRVLKNLEHEKQLQFPTSSVHEGAAILAAYDLSPSDTVNMNREQVLGFVTEVGSAVSHTAILARSLELPAIVAVPNLLIEAKMGQFTILDGYNGDIIFNPCERTLEYYRNLQAQKEQERRDLSLYVHQPAETTDGRLLRISANVEFAHEFGALKDSGAEGVGLFRSEFFLLNYGKLPDEDAQYEHYKELIESATPHEVVFRTLDAGGDKLPFEEEDDKEENPFLGWRGIRVSLSRVDSFKEQLRAILRASVHGKAAVMFPMVSALSELLEAKACLDECRAELRDAGVAYSEELRVGVMIEVPSAAMIADLLAPHVDFFSIGSNDLTQYTIAVDRVNFRVADMFRPAHPGVVRLMHQTIKAGIPTSICGETGSDLVLLPLLVGLGMESISAGTHVLPALRYAIKHLNYGECRELAQRALQLGHATEIRDLCRDLAQKSYPSLLGSPQ